MTDSWEQADFKAETDPGFDSPLVVHRHRGRPPARVALVFVHGLGGSRYGTWGNFPTYLFQKFPQADVALYAYRTANKRLFSFESFDLETQSQLLAEELRERAYAGYVLIGHSLGGMVCRGVVERLHAANEKRTLGRILGILLLASPQLGTSRTPGLLSIFSKDARVLRLFNPFVERVSDCFQNHVMTVDGFEETSEGAGRACRIPIYAVVSASDLWWTE